MSSTTLLQRLRQLSAVDCDTLDGEGECLLGARTTAQVVDLTMPPTAAGALEAFQIPDHLGSLQSPEMNYTY